MVKLSPHFYLHEFTDSQTATRDGIDNEPAQYALKNLCRIAYTLEIIRSELGAPISISSGYRGPALNKAIGGSTKSKHMQGLAVDFTVRGYTPFEAVERIREIVGFNKLIIEFGRWVHLDLSDHLKNQVLIASKRNGKTHYEVLT